MWKTLKEQYEQDDCENLQRNLHASKWKFEPANITRLKEIHHIVHLTV